MKRARLIPALAAVALCGAAPALAGPAASDPEAVWASIEPSLPEAMPIPRRSPGVAGGAPSAERPASSAPPWSRTFGSLAAVVALIGLLAWGYRAVTSSGFSRRGRRAGVIEIISRTALSPRQGLVLVRVGPRMVLVGTTHERLTALDVIDDAELCARLAGEELRDNRGAPGAFQTLLERHAAELDDGPARPAAPLESASPLARACDRLQAAMRRIRAKAG
ncbi:MAG: flagellar biosynthetic protein FliO [Phycisphaerae bacterium]|jgi:flagellar biogenesis protein FliO